MINFVIDTDEVQRLDVIETPANKGVFIKVLNATRDVTLVLYPVLGPKPIAGAPSQIDIRPDASDVIRISPFALRRVAQTSQLRFTIYENNDPEPDIRGTGTISLLPVKAPIYWPGDVPPEVVSYKGDPVEWQLVPLIYGGLNA